MHGFMLLLGFLVGLLIGGVLMLAAFTVLIVREARKSALDPAAFPGAAVAADPVGPVSSHALSDPPGAAESATEAQLGDRPRQAAGKRPRTPCALCRALRAALGLSTKSLTGK